MNNSTVSKVFNKNNISNNIHEDEKNFQTQNIMMKVYKIFKTVKVRNHENSKKIKLT